MGSKGGLLPSPVRLHLDRIWADFWQKDVIWLEWIWIDKIYFNQYSQAVKRESRPIQAVGANGKINFVISGSAVQIRPWAPYFNNLRTVDNIWRIFEVFLKNSSRWIPFTANLRLIRPRCLPLSSYWRLHLLSFQNHHRNNKKKYDHYCQDQ